MITVNVTNCNATVLVGENTFIIPKSEVIKSDFTALIHACELSENEENVAALTAWLVNAQDLEVVDIIDDLFLHNTKTNKYYFADDTKQLLEIPSLLVDVINDLKKNGIPYTPIVEFFKRLRKNPKYSLPFADLAIESLMNTYLDNDRYVDLINKGWNDEVAYCSSSRTVFTLTKDGNIIGYKKAAFKNHKYNTETGEMIDRYPFSYDEETGVKQTQYPTIAERFKYNIYSKETSKLKQIDENTHYVVGQVVNQSKGQPGFEKEETSLRFYGHGLEIDKYVNATRVKVLIAPETITSFSAKNFDNVASPIFQIIEFANASSETVVNPSDLNVVVSDYCEKYYANQEVEINDQYSKVIERINVVKSI